MNRHQEYSFNHKLSRAVILIQDQESRFQLIFFAIIYHTHLILHIRIFVYLCIHERSIYDIHSFINNNSLKKYESFPLNKS